MAIIDIIIGVIILIFMISGFKSGFVKKVIGIACLILAMILGTKYAADVNELLFLEMGVSGRTGFAISFLTIVVLVTLTQAIIYKVFLHELVDSLWNNIFGMLIGIVEGAVVASMGLILMTIYLELPSEEMKSESQLYKPVKNFAPVIFDQINTLLPESEDFYELILRTADQGMKSLEK